MKITFLTPPSLDESPKPAERIFGCSYGLYPIPHIFALTAAAVLEEAGYVVEYVDGALENWMEEEFRSFAEQDDSDVYCLYSVNLSKKTDNAALSIIKEIRRTVPVIFLGPAPTDKPEDFLSIEQTFVIRGEPEITLRELVREIEGQADFGGVAGICYNSGEGMITNPPRQPIADLDELPFPARHLAPKNVYYNPKLGEHPFTAVLTSRGCPYGCIYCVPNSLSFARELEFKRFNSKRKPPVRLRSVGNVVREFQQLADEGYRAVSILDDNFPWGEKRTVAICKGIEETGIKWGCLSRADRLTEPIVKAMADANCQYVDIGVESFDEEILEYVKKRIDARAIENGIALLKDYGITVKLNIMLGAAPFETRENIERTLQKVKEIEPDAVMYSICTPFPGTEFYEIAKANGWMVTGDYVPVDLARKSIVSYPSLSKEELEELVKRANRDFYLSPRVLWRNRGKVKSIPSLIQGLRTLKAKLED